VPRFAEIQRHRVADRVAQELLRLIASGDLVPGERLPGERQLAEMMNVSRVSVRAALQQLKAQGFVAAVQGGGTRITAKADEIDTGLERLGRIDGRNLRDLAEIRAHLEVWAARRAAEAASERQIADIETALEIMAAPGRDRRTSAEDDLAFHLAVARASGSAVYLHLMSVLGDILEKMFAFHRHTLYPGHEDDERLFGQHQRVAAAIRARDPEAAAAAMAEHLDFILTRYRTADAAAE